MLTVSKAYSLIHGDAVLSDRVVKDATLVVKNGRIAAVGPAAEVRSAGEIFDMRGKLILPGLIDTHVHGALGCDFMDGTAESFSTICRAHAAGGTTALLATTVTDEISCVVEVLKSLRSAIESPDSLGARILGAHVEGPFLSPERPGVHDVSEMRPPTTEGLRVLVDAGCPIRILTFAPEFPGTAEFLKVLGQHGIQGSAGHSDAWDSDAKAAFEAGLRRVTHTFNCMSTARRRGALREAGLLEFALSEPEITCELIADGIHVSPTLMKMLYRAKGAAGICLITDASAGCGMTEDQEFLIAGRACKVSNGMAVTREGDSLAGGTSTMLALVRNMVSLVGVPVVEALRMASRNPAAAAGVTDEMGALEAGKRADFLIVKPDLELVATYIEGACVFKTEERS